MGTVHYRVWKNYLGPCDSAKENGLCVYVAFQEADECLLQSYV